MHITSVNVVNIVRGCSLPNGIVHMDKLPELPCIVQSSHVEGLACTMFSDLWNLGQTSTYFASLHATFVWSEQLA